LANDLLLIPIEDIAGSRKNLLSLACVASVSSGFSARSRHFLLFDGAKIVASATNGRTFLRSLQCSRVQKAKKCFDLLDQTCGKPYGIACYAGYFKSSVKSSQWQRSILYQTLHIL